MDATIAQTRYVTALFDSRRSVQPMQHALSWDELALGLTSHHIFATKHDAWLWSPTQYRSGATRGREGVESVSLLVADIDDGTPAETLCYWLHDSVPYIVVSTWSHSREVPHLRVIVPVVEPIPVEQFDEVWRRFNAHLLHSHIDPSTKDPSRMYYAPSCPLGAQERVAERFDDAPPLNWRDLPPVADPVVRATPTASVLDAVPARSELEHRARCFLAKWYRDLASMGPETGRHNAVRSKACAAGGLMAAGLLTEADAFEALMAACEANGLIDDPGGAAEQTVRDGLSYGATTPWTPDSLPDSPTWRARLELPKMGPQSVDSSSHLHRWEQEQTFLTVHTARQVAEQSLPRVAWIARPWIAEGGLTEVDGKVKQAGKTTWLLAMLRCVLDGEPFMGEPTTRTPVVLLSEQSPRSLQQALRRAGLEERDDLFIVFWHETREYKWEALVEAAARYCRQVGARLLAVDTLSQFIGLHGDSENNSGEAMRAMQPLQQAIARDGLAVVFNRHERKSGGDVGDSGRGSSAYAGSVDIIVSLRRANENYRPTVRHLHALSRFDETPQRTVIDLQGMSYVMLGDEDSATSEVAQTKVWSALSGPDNPLTTAELQEQVTIRRADMFAAINALLAAGRIRRIGRGKVGDAYRYFRVSEDAAVDDDDYEQDELP